MTVETSTFTLAAFAAVGALGFLFGGLVGGAATLGWIERQDSACERDQREAVAALGMCADRISEADRLVGLCERVAETWHSTADWYQRAYLRSAR